VPLAALTKGEKATHQIQRTFGDYQVEDLWLPYFAVSSNLTRGAVSVHSSGMLWQAIRASVALPGILPPMRSPEGDVLVDGGIMNNLPVDVMREVCRGAGRILAVNVRPEVHMGAGDLPDDGVLSGWSLLGRRINAFAARPAVPSIVQVLMRTTETGNVLSTEVHEQGAELTFNPPVAGVGLMEFAAYERLAEVGYRHAMERLESWDKRIA
jgi:NTE family protein